MTYVHRIFRSAFYHLPVGVGAPLSEFQVIAERYPVYRIDRRLIRPCDEDVEV